MESIPPPPLNALQTSFSPPSLSETQSLSIDDVVEKPVSCNPSWVPPHPLPSRIWRSQGQPGVKDGERNQKKKKKKKKKKRRSFGSRETKGKGGAKLAERRRNKIKEEKGFRVPVLTETTTGATGTGSTTKHGDEENIESDSRSGRWQRIDAVVLWSSPYEWRRALRCFLDDEPKRRKEWRRSVDRSNHERQPNDRPTLRKTAPFSETRSNEKGKTGKAH